MHEKAFLCSLFFSLFSFPEILNYPFDCSLSENDKIKNFSVKIFHTHHTHFEVLCNTFLCTSTILRLRTVNCIYMKNRVTW